MSYRLSLQIVLLALLLNIGGATLTTYLDLPIFLDAVGTMLAAVLLGPWVGGLVGLSSNILKGLFHTILSIPFALVNLGIGLITGYLALIIKDYRQPHAPLVVGTVVAITTPMMAAPIAAYMFGGITAHGSDKFVIALVNSGQSILSSSFWGRIPSSFLDKGLSAYLVFTILKVWSSPAENQYYMKKRG